MDIKHIFSIADNEPDFLEIFGETEDQIDDWRHGTEARIYDLIIRASRMYLRENCNSVWLQEVVLSSFQRIYSELFRVQEAMGR